MRNDTSSMVGSGVRLICPAPEMGCSVKTMPNPESLTSGPVRLALCQCCSISFPDVYKLPCCKITNKLYFSCVNKHTKVAATRPRQGYGFAQKGARNRSGGKKPSETNHQKQLPTTRLGDFGSVQCQIRAVFRRIVSLRLTMEPGEEGLKDSCAVGRLL